MHRDSLILNVSVPNDNGTSNTHFIFDVLIHQANKHTVFMTLGPVPVTSTCHKCVFIEFDPFPTQNDDLGHVATIQLFCFSERCGKEKPLEPKRGARSMLLGALYALLHLAHNEQRWPHLNTFSLNDESDYKCKLSNLPAAKQYPINTFATDLLTQNTTYYQRHLNAHLSSVQANTELKEVRKIITGPVSLKGFDFLKQLNHIMMTESGMRPNKEQSDWMTSNSVHLIQIFDDAFNRGECWESAFKHVQAQFGCKMYACCFEQLIIFFNMFRLKGASYEVHAKELPGYGQVKTSLKDSSINVALVGGKSNTNINILHNKLFSKRYSPKSVHS